MLIEAEQQGDVCVVRVSGRLGAGAADEYLCGKAREIKSLNCPKVLVDLRELQSVGSSGIAFFVDLYTSVTRKPSGRLVLVGPSVRVNEVLVLTRITTIIPAVKDIADGFAFLNGGEKTSASGAA